MEQEQKTNGLKGLLNVLFKHKYKIITVFLATMIVVMGRIFLSTPVYEATSILMVQFGREYIFRPEVGEEDPTVRFDRNEVISADTEILFSTDLLEKVILCLGVENIYPNKVKQPQDGMMSIEAAAHRFKNDLSVNPLRNSNVIRVSFQHEDPQISAQALNQLVDCFLERHLQLFSTTRSDFVERQLSVYHQKLREAENKLHAFRQENQVYDIELQKTYLIGQHKDLDVALETAQVRFHELREKVSSLTNRMETIPESIPLYDSTTRTNNIDTAKAKLLELQLEEQDLLSKYDEGNRKVAMVRKQIQMTKDYLAELEDFSTQQNETLGRNPVYNQLQTDLYEAQVEMSSEEAKVAAIKKQLNQLNGKIQEFDAKETELQNLQREAENNEKNYNIYVTKLEEALISDEMDRSKIANIKVIQKAIVPIRPVPSKKKLQLAVGVILGMASGLALALFSEYIIGQDISSPEDVKKHLGLPVLATFPYKKQNKSRV